MIWFLALLLIACGDPTLTVPTPKRWMVLCADNDGGFWVDPRDGKIEIDPALRRKKRKPVKATGLSLPPPVRARRHRDVDGSTVGELTVRTDHVLGRKRLSTQRRGEKRVYLTDDRYECFFPALRPDGKFVAYKRWDLKARDGKARLFDLVVREIASGKERVFIKRTYLTEHAWSPDGKTLAVAGVAWLDLYDAATGKRTQRWKTTGFDKRLWNHGATGLIWNPAGTHIAGRFVFVGGRSASGPGEFEPIFGDHQLIVLPVKGGAVKIHTLPTSTYEGPVRGELRSAPAKR